MEHLGQEIESARVLTVFVPVLNGVTGIRRTIESVLSQEGEFDVRLHVQDGGSTDGTLGELEAIQAGLNDGSINYRFNNLTFTFRSEPDSGMYDAIRRAARGVVGADQSPMTWINAGDFFLPGAFALVARIFSAHSNVSWLVPPTFVYEEHTPKHFFQMHYPQQIVASGLCDGINWRTIQQEGSFWRRWLWNESEGAIDSMRLAGDWALWRKFAMSATPFHLIFPTAVFSICEGQLSGSSNKYRAEIERHRSRSATKQAFAAIVSDPSELRVAVIDGDCRIDWRPLQPRHLIDSGSTEDLLMAVSQKDCPAIQRGRLVEQASSLELAEALSRRDPKFKVLLDSGSGPQEQRSRVFLFLRESYRLLPDSWRVKMRPLIRRMFGG